MGDVSYIPNRLKNAAENGHVAGAIDIFDDVVERDQQAINSDVCAPSSGLMDRVAVLQNQVHFDGSWDAENDPVNIVSPGSGKITTTNAVRGAIDVRTGYFTCGTTGGTTRKDVTAGGFVLTNGGSIKVKMDNANTADNATMNISPTATIVSANTKPLRYNGEPVNAENTWGAGETISIFYDGNYYQATNAQGGGGKAEKIKYDNSTSGLAAKNVQAGLDEIMADIDAGSEIVDINTPQLEWYISGDGHWHKSSQAYPYYCRIVAIESNTRYRITAQDNKEAMYALLDSDVRTEGAQTSKPILIATGESVDVNSCDYTYLYLRYGNNANTIDYPKTVERLVTIKEHFDTVDSAIVSEEVIDTTNNNLIGVSTGGDKKWNTAYNGFVLPVASGEMYDIIAQESKGTIILPLKTFTWEAGSSYESNIATGYSDRVVLSAGQTYRFVVPSDCICLYVQTSLSGGDVTPTIIKRGTMSQLDTKPIINGKNGVTSDGVFRESNVRMEALVLGHSLTYIQLGADMVWHEFSSSDIRNSAVYDLYGGETVCLKAARGPVYYAFLASISPVSNGNRPTAKSGRYYLAEGDSIEITAPAGNRWLYVSTQLTVDGVLVDRTPWMVKYIKTSDAVDSLGFNVELTGKVTNVDVTPSACRTILQGGKIYKITIDNPYWERSNIPNGTPPQNSYTYFTVAVNDVNIIRKTIVDAPKKEYYFRLEEESEVQINARGNYGEKIGISVKEVTNEFNKQIYDIYFVDKETTSESMMVKVGNGDLVKYRLNASAGMGVIKIYDRPVRDDDYLLETISAGDEAGVVEGQFIPKVYNKNLHELNRYVDEVFVVMESVKSTGFIPYFRVYNEGNAEDNKIVYPHQFIVDPDGDIFDIGEGGGKNIIFSTDDETATSYDNGSLGGFQIIPDDGMYYMLYSSFGATEHLSPNVCFAYSEDGINWTKGFPQGIEAPIPGTNVIFDITNTYLLVNEFVGTDEVVNEFAVARVNDAENKWRMFCAIRNVPHSDPTDPDYDPDGTIVGMCHYLLKSNDLVHWSVVKKVDTKPHDTYSSMFCYDGDKLKIYLRMWNYKTWDGRDTPIYTRRMVGVMWLDIWGNVIVPATGIGFKGDYNPAAARIGANTDLLIPTNFMVNDDGTWMHGDDELESYIVDNGVIRYAPSYNLDLIKERDGGTGSYGGWAMSSGLVSIGMKQYIAINIRQGTHTIDAEASGSQIRLYPIKWITYDSYNTSGGVG